MKRFFLTLSAVLLVLGCHVSTKDDKPHPKGLVKLEKSLQQTFPEIRFRVTTLKGDSSDEVVFQGPGVTIEEDYIRMERHAYTLNTSLAVETHRYIFVPIAAHGGTGRFWDLNVVDKKTLVTADEVSLGDRVWIIDVFELDSHSDAVGISYIRRDIESGEVIYDLSKMVTKHFQMREGTLEEITAP